MKKFIGEIIMFVFIVSSVHAAQVWTTDAGTTTYFGPAEANYYGMAGAGKTFSEGAGKIKTCPEVTVCEHGVTTYYGCEK